MSKKNQDIIPAAAHQYSTLVSSLKSRHHLWLLLPIFCAVLAFGQSAGFDFVSDDRAFFIDNHNLVAQPYSAYFSKGVWMFSSLDIPKGQLYRPFSLILYRVQSELWGNRPMGFHLVNITVHLINIVLVFLLLSKILPQASGMSVALATSIFSIHPLQVESVSWILGINDAWASVWLLTGILLMVQSGEKKLPYISVFAILSAFAAMLSKEVAYTFPALLAIVLTMRSDLYSARKISLYTIISSIPLFCVLLLRGTAVERPELVFSLAGLKNLLSYFFGYLKLTILPLPQRFYLIPPERGMVAEWEIVIGIVTLLIIILGITKIREGRKFLLLSLTWFLLVLAPALAVAFHATRPTFAFRVTYVSLISLSMMLLWMMTSLHESRRALIQRCTAATIIIFTVISFWSAMSWKNQGNFIDLALASTPANTALHIEKGDYQAETGDKTGAIASYKKAIAETREAKTKDRVIAHERLGVLYAKLKRIDESRIEFEAILEIAPQNVTALNGLGNVAWLANDLMTAKQYYELALKQKPEHINARKNLEAVKRLLGTP